MKHPDVMPEHEPDLPHTGGTSIAADRLRGLVERIERLNEERKLLGEDVRDIFVEATSAGFDAKVLREVIRRRKMKPEAASDMDSLLDVYLGALA